MCPGNTRRCPVKAKSRIRHQRGRRVCQIGTMIRQCRPRLRFPRSMRLLSQGRARLHPRSVRCRPGRSGRKRQCANPKHSPPGRPQVRTDASTKALSTRYWPRSARWGRDPPISRSHRSPRLLRLSGRRFRICRITRSRQARLRHPPAALSPVRQGRLTETSSGRQDHPVRHRPAPTPPPRKCRRRHHHRAATSGRRALRCPDCRRHTAPLPPPRRPGRRRGNSRAQTERRVVHPRRCRRCARRVCLRVLPVPLHQPVCRSCLQRLPLDIVRPSFRSGRWWRTSRASCALAFRCWSKRASPVPR